MRVVVTGGAGFIGSHIVDLLVDAGYSVTVVDVLLPEAHRGAPEYLNGNANFERVDVRDVASLRAIVRDADAVVHQASMVGLGRSFADVGKYVANNDAGTAALLEALYASSWNGRFVLASSMVVYGEGSYSCGRHGRVHPGPRAEADLRAGRFDPACPECGLSLTPQPVTERARLDPRTVYAATKVHQEHLCAAFGRETKASVAALRYHNVYGPRMPSECAYAGVAAIFRSALETGRPPRVFEDGAQLRDFTHVRDVARASRCCLEAPMPVTGAFNIGSGTARSILEMAGALTHAFGDAARPAVSGEYRLGDVRHVFASSERAYEVLGWRAEIDFEIGMKEFATAPLRHAARFE